MLSGLILWVLQALLSHPIVGAFVAFLDVLLLLELYLQLRDMGTK